MISTEIRDPMTKDEFQKNVLEEITRELGKGDVPLERVRELAAAALDLGAKYPAEIPNEEAMEIVRRYAEIAKDTSAEIKNEMKKDDEGKIDEIRRSMGLRS